MADDTYIFQLVSITSQSVSKLVRKRMHLLRRGWLDVSKLRDHLFITLGFWGDFFGPFTYLGSFSVHQEGKITIF